MKQVKCNHYLPDAVWIRNMENNNTQAENIHQHLPQKDIKHLVKSQSQQCGPAEKNKPRPHRLTNPKEKVELDWPHPQKTCHKHPPTSPDMEGKRERGRPRNWRRSRNVREWAQLGKAGAKSHKQSEMGDGREWPMHPKGAKDII